MQVEKQMPNAAQTAGTKRGSQSAEFRAKSNALYSFCALRTALCICLTSFCTPTSEFCLSPDGEGKNISCAGKKFVWEGTECFAEGKNFLPEGTETFCGGKNILREVTNSSGEGT